MKDLNKIAENGQIDWDHDQHIWCDRMAEQNYHSARINGESHIVYRAQYANPEDCHE